MSDFEDRRRPIRSFVRRQGRITAAQQRALALLWPRYGVELTPDVLDLRVIFGRAVPVILEIGFGDGEAIANLAAANPDCDYLGVEVHRPGVGRLLRELALRELSNVRIVCADANDVLARLPDGALAAVAMFFPDPWPKLRHHKRRLVQLAFVDSVRRRLALGGLFHLATDWDDYAAHMLSVLSAASGFDNTAGVGNYAESSAARPLTKFERRGRKLGHRVHDLIFRRRA